MITTIRTVVKKPRYFESVAHHEFPLLFIGNDDQIAYAINPYDMVVIAIGKTIAYKVGEVVTQQVIQYWSVYEGEITLKNQ